MLRNASRWMAIAIVMQISAYAIPRTPAIEPVQEADTSETLFHNGVILSANPLAVSTEELLSVEVLATIVGGTFEWCKPGYESLCVYSPSTLGR